MTEHDACEKCGRYGLRWSPVGSWLQCPWCYRIHMGATPASPELARRLAQREMDRLRLAPPGTYAQSVLRENDEECRRIGIPNRCTQPDGVVGPITVADLHQKIYDPIDPLDVKHDGVTLRNCLAFDVGQQREDGGICRRRLSTTQRAAVSSHWSAQLRAKVQASKVRERNQVVVDLEDDYE